MVKCGFSLSRGGLISLNKGKLRQAVQAVVAPVRLVDDLEDAELVLTTKSSYQRRTNALRKGGVAGTIREVENAAPSK